MRVLLLDANRLGANGPGTPEATRTTYIACPKWRAVWSIAQAIGADIAWRSPKVDPDVRGGYDVVIFNRALPGIKDNAAWIAANPDAKLFHVTNDYAVTGAALYVAARELNRPVSTIANYVRAKSTPAGRMADRWLTANVNALVYEPDRVTVPPRGTGCVYYGAARYGRQLLFQKYLTGHVTVCGPENLQSEFRALGVEGPFYPSRVPWHKAGLTPWASSLYLEDSVTPDYSPFLSNRFYEALSYDVYPVFVDECRRTIGTGGYEIPAELVVSSPDEIPAASAYEDAGVMRAWRKQAADERQRVLGQIAAFIGVEGA